MTSNGLVTSPEVLMELKEDLLNLSKSLHEIYSLMNADMSNLGEIWRDGKYEEFISGYKPQINKCEEIAEKYEDWCTRILDPAIEQAINIVGHNLNPDGGSASGGGVSSGSGEGGAVNAGGSKPLSKRDKLLIATGRVQQMIKDNEKMAMNLAIKNKLDPGMDPNERQRVYNPPLREKNPSALLNALLNGKER